MGRSGTAKEQARRRTRTESARRTRAASTSEALVSGTAEILNTLYGTSSPRRPTGRLISREEKVAMSELFYRFENVLAKKMKKRQLQHRLLDTETIAELVGAALHTSARSVLDAKNAVEVALEAGGDDVQHPDDVFEIAFATDKARGFYARSSFLSETHLSIVRYIMDSRMRRSLGISSKYLTDVLASGLYRKYHAMEPPARGRGRRKADAADPDEFLNELFAPVHVSQETLRKHLLRLGYDWKDLSKSSEVVRRQSAYVQQRVSRYIVLYRRLLRDQFTFYQDKDGKNCVNVIVYFDETFVHRNDCPRFSWGPRGTEMGMRSKGDRFCITAFICELGVIPGSIHSFVGRDSGDYHDMMDSNKFIENIERLAACMKEWISDSSERGFYSLLKKRIRRSSLPQIDHVVCQIVMDNAPYHKCVDEQLIFKLSSVAKMNKTDLVDVFMKFAGRVQPQASSASSAASAASSSSSSSSSASQTPAPPFADEVRRSMMNMTKKDIVQKVRELHKSLRTSLGNRQYAAFNQIYAKGYHVYTTPPYHPEFQPIELFWNIGKAKVKFNAGMHNFTATLFSNWIALCFQSIDDDKVRSLIEKCSEVVEAAAIGRDLPEEVTSNGPHEIDLQKDDCDEVEEDDIPPEHDADIPVTHLSAVAGTSNDVAVDIVVGTFH